MSEVVAKPRKSLVAGQARKDRFRDHRRQVRCGANYCVVSFSVVKWCAPPPPTSHSLVRPCRGLEDLPHRAKSTWLLGNAARKTNCLKRILPPLFGLTLLPFFFVALSFGFWCFFFLLFFSYPLFLVLCMHALLRINITQECGHFFLQCASRRARFR